MTDAAEEGIDTQLTTSWRKRPRCMLDTGSMTAPHTRSEWNGGYNKTTVEGDMPRYLVKGKNWYTLVRLAAEQRQDRGIRVTCVGAGVAAPSSQCIGGVRACVGAGSAAPSSWPPMQRLRTTVGMCGSWRSRPIVHSGMWESWITASPSDRRHLPHAFAD